MEKINERIKRIIWIDEKNIQCDGRDPGEFFEIHNTELYLCNSVKNAFNLIENSQEEVKKGNISYYKKKFEFNLFYVIISGSLAEEYYKELISKTKILNILPATIIYCKNVEYHKKKPYYLDKFLNPGGVTNDIQTVIDYININEYHCKPEMSIFSSLSIKNEENENNLNGGSVFIRAEKLKDIAYPILFGQLINSSLIIKDELKYYQDYLINKYPNLFYLIKPSLEKKMDIAYDILAKFYAHMYTVE